MGFLIGFLTYVDVSGIVLLLPVILLPFVTRESKSIRVWFGRMFLTILTAVGGFAGFIYLDGYLTNSGFSRILSAWLITFQPEVPNIVSLLQASTPEVMILLVIMAINVFSFRRRKDRDIITVWTLMTFALAALYVMGITTESMNNRPLLLTLMCIIAAVSVRELFQVAPVKVTVEEKMNIIELDAEQMPQAEPAMIQKPRFLENPLPLPKKRVKKSMDYAFVPETSQMKYDVEVSETDDFVV